MADDAVTIDLQTIEDNSDMLHVEFEGEIAEERYQFAVQYAVLEALSGERLNEEAVVAVFKDFREDIAAAALKALVRETGEDVILISETDVEDE